jgi:hypothetical protein
MPSTKLVGDAKGETMGQWVRTWRHPYGEAVSNNGKLSVRRRFFRGSILRGRYLNELPHQTKT